MAEGVDESPPWHARDVSEALRALGVDRHGLTKEEAERRLARHGANALPEPPRRTRLQRLASQFNNLLIHVLIVSGIVTALLGHWTDAIVILAVVVINAAIGYWQEGRAEDALAAVRNMLSRTASVRRDGGRITIEAEKLVPGDIVLLEAGDSVPADLRLIEVRGLRSQESALTGESVAVAKETAPVAEDAPLGDRNSMAFSGTLVTSGRATGVVVATGAEAQIGRIGRMLGEIAETATPLLRQIDRFARLLTFIILGVCAAVFVFAVTLRDYAAEDAFLAMVGMAVAAIPEGLPAVLTITLALGVQRMARRHAIVRRLPAVETLGAVSVICTDKTGTLTLNEMVVRTLVTRHDTPPIRFEGDGYAPEGAARAGDGEPSEEEAQAAQRLALTGLLCSDARLHEHEEGAWRVEGDPMEGALLALARKAGLDPDAAREEHARLDEIPFDAAHRLMATLNADGDGAVIHVKGAPDRLLQHCAHEAADGGTAPIDREAWSRRLEDLAKSGHRVLAFATRTASPAGGLSMGDIDGLTLLGLAGFIDPARPEAIAAVADCHRAGVDVKMITGDHVLTALAVARELGLETSGGALTGAEIEDMDEEELRRRAPEIDIIARAAPEHKLRLVEALQSRDLVIAMTGDGVNDAPALKRADVGVAMGIKGTAAAKDAARVVLADDNFASIVAAVREGRTIYDNIKKVIAWNLPTNGGESLIIISAILFGVALPMTAVQILWINMVTAVALGLTLSFEPAEPGVMDRPPRRMDAPLLDAEMVWRVVLVSILFALAVFGVFFWSLQRGDSLDYARTLVVNLIVAMEITYLFSVRYLHLTSLSWTGVVGTPAVLIGVATAIALQFGFTYAPPLQAVFATEGLAPGDGAVMVAIAFGLLVLLEAEKWLRRLIASARRKKV